jgi:hypothetical protein
VPASITLGGVRLSGVMPFTWLVQVPGLSAFREADRLTLLGLVPAALLGGSTVGWLAARARPLLGQARQPRTRAMAAGTLLLISVLGAALEAGWPGGGPVRHSIPASLPALDAPIAADHSGSVVVDVPFGIRGGLPERYGAKIEPEALALASSDGHPRAISYTSWIPLPTLRAVRRHPFYARLVAAQDGHPGDARQARLARADARRLDVGWVLVWRARPEVLRYLAQTGFRFDYRADGVAVYRPAGFRRGPT